MTKYKRNERVGLLMKVLVERPNQLITYSDFADIFDAAKSTISEDIAIVRAIIHQGGMGRVITVPGAAGGVKYIAALPNGQQNALLKKLCQMINHTDRTIAGGFIYIADLLYDPQYMGGIAKIFAQRFADKQVDYVMTVETKGIPMAFATASQLNVPLVIARKENKVTDGPTVSINYVSGSSGKLGTMYLHKRAIKAGGKVLIIDDLMKGGGTIKGLIELVKEFEATTAGVGVLLDMKTAGVKLVDQYCALLKIENDKDKFKVMIN